MLLWPFLYGHMNAEAVLCTAVALPIIGALFLPFVGRKSPAARNWSAFLLILSSCALSVRLIPAVLSGSPVSICAHLPLDLNFIISADALAVFMAIVSSFISAIVVFYSFDYISHYDNQNEYYTMVTLFLGSMMGLIYSGNLILMYVFWELTAIASWRLISFFRGPEHVERGNKAFLVTVGGALLMLLGCILLYQQTGTFDFAVLKEAAASHPVSSTVVALILAGILSKSATLPFHTWLPDAGVAPSPVTALLHAAVLVKIGVYVFARLFVFTMPLDVHWQNVVCVIAAVSALVSAGAALAETDMKRIIAYSTVSQIGFIFLGLAAGSPLALAGGLLYILMHGVAKAGLFLCAGIVEQNAHTKDITRLGGLMRTMPLTGTAFFICSLSVMGIPPLGGFFSKYMVISGAVAGGKTLMAFVFLAGAVMTILYLLRIFCMIFLGEARVSAAEESGPMVWSVMACAVLSVVLGVCISYPSLFVQKIIGSMAH